MAKVKITGHASGSGVITVTAPNTSTDRVITLPDATATLATTAEAFNPDAAQVFNESGADVDFRVEASGQSKAIIVNGATGYVGINTTGMAGAPLHILKTAGANTIVPLLILDSNVDSTADGKGGSIVFQDIASYANTAEISAARLGGGSSSEVKFKLRNTEILSLRSDGRGLSQFTAKAWASVNQTGTQAIRDSHNVSSITDDGAGQTTITFTSSMANGNYSAVASAGGAAYHNALTKWNGTPAAGSVKTGVLQVSNGNYTDDSQLSVIVFGD